MKKLSLLLFVVLLIAFCGCNIFGNDNDDKNTLVVDTTSTEDTTVIDNTTPFEGSWGDEFVLFTFQGNTVKFCYELNNAFNFESSFTYDSVKKSVKWNNFLGEEVEQNYMVRDNLLLLGDKDTYSYNIGSFPKLNSDFDSNVSLILAGKDGINENNKKARINYYYKDADYTLDSLQNVSIELSDFISYRDTNRDVSIVIKDLTFFEKIDYDVESPVSGLYIYMYGYDSDYNEVGKEISWTVNKLRIKSYSYCPTDRLEAVFYDLKDSDGDTILDTLKLDIDCSGVDAFKTMLKNL